jgi:NitT/TauT family transport system ATP-binding protein
MEQGSGTGKRLPILKGPLAVGPEWLPTDPHLVIRDLKKTYQIEADAIESIRHISLSIRRGEFVSVLGPSGCGKSTLLMMIAGLVAPTGGEILLDGRPVAGPRRETSVIFQTPVLFPWRTILANVLFPVEVFKLDKSKYRDEALRLLEMTGLTAFMDRLPKHLSGGMAQRVPLCRALITNPELLLMDEPFSALDALTRDDMNVQLMKIWEQFRKTVVFVTHSIREAVFLSERVIVLSRRPAVIAAEVKVDLPRPRTLDIQETSAFNGYCAKLRASLEH